MPEQNPPTSTAGSLNDKNVNMLRALVLAHVLACVLWIVGLNLTGFQDMKASLGVLGITAKAFSLMLLTLASLATIALRNTLPPQWRACLVFLRWDHPLPGCRAFSRYAKRDDRISTDLLAKEYGTLPTGFKEQNELWYSILKKHEDQSPYIAYNHRVFLLLMDTMGILLVLMPLLFTVLCVAGSLDFVWPLLAVMLVELLIAWIAARNAGVGLVTDVLALESAALRPAAAGHQSTRPAGKTRRTH